MKGPEADIPADKDYWRKACLRRIRFLIDDLESLDPADLAIVVASPEADKIREWLSQEYDL